MRSARSKQCGSGAEGATRCCHSSQLPCVCSPSCGEPCEADSTADEMRAVDATHTTESGVAVRASVAPMPRFRCPAPPQPLCLAVQGESQARGRVLCATFRPFILGDMQ